MGNTYNQFLNTNPSGEPYSPEKLKELGLIMSSNQSSIKPHYLKNYSIIVETIAGMSYCTRKKVGALIITAEYDNILSYGFNGNIPGFPNVCENEQTGETLPEVLHAEFNAITKMAKKGITANNSVLFVNYSPCIECTKLIISSGIKEIYFIHLYKDQYPLFVLAAAGIKLYQIED